MKKRFILVFVFIFAFLLCACQTPAHVHKFVDGVCECGEVEQVSVDSYEAVWKDFIDELIPAEITKKIDFPSEYIFEDGTIGFTELVSSNEKSISKKGLYFIDLFDNDVTLDAILMHESGETYTVTKTVFAKGMTSGEGYVNYIKDTLIPDSVYKDTELSTVESEFFKERSAEGKITYTSSNPNAFTADGKYTLETKDDVVVTMSFTVEVNGKTFSGSKDITVLGNNDELYVGNGKKWLEEEWYQADGITDDFVLPITDDKGMVSFVWTSLSLDIIDNAGKFTSFSVDLEFTLQVDVTMNDYTETMEMTMKTITTEEALNYILEKMHQDELYQSTFVTYVVSSGYHNEDYGFLKFYTQDVNESQLLLSQSDTSNTYGTLAHNSNVDLLEVKDGIIPRALTYKRPLIQKKSVEFITIHDTGDNAFDASEWTNEITTSTREVSWHFTVDDKDIYQHVPLDEVAYHAGDGRNEFALLDTGVKYTVKKPELVFSKEDNYLYVNGIKSNLMAPTYEGSYYHAITPAGLYTCLGENGNYYIDAYHYDKTYRVIGNNGGNRNSIGIETCIVDGVKYSMVMRNTANLVAHLLNVYDLDTNRIMQHRNFSGKFCPQSMIRADEKTVFTYANFIELVEIEYFILKCLPNVKFTYKSNNPDILDNNGNLLKYVSEETEVSYEVTIEYSGKKLTKTYTTTVFPK